jgi:UDPglucose--hexose-1-phosphate uridylyltransferase
MGDFGVSVSRYTDQLVDYAVRCGLIGEADRAFFRNSIIGELGGFDYVSGEYSSDAPLCEILAALTDFAAERGLIKENTGTYRDLFDTRLMGALTPPPREVIRRFDEEYARSPRAATDYFYSLSKNSNYIRSDRIAKDVRWRVPCEFGELDITVNLAKPEKDPREIALSRAQSVSDYPMCPLCPENEGFFGNAAKPARQNLRLIPIALGGERWYLQYSPYVYYNEHCIALSAEHRPMRIDRAAFIRLFDFLDIFPHYFIGSNADLPIVGGSILSHEHFQGGRYSFAMERAPVDQRLELFGYERVSAGILRWPMSVIRLSSRDREELTELSDKILGVWREYTDEEAFIYAEHNTITPIARIRGGRYEIDLVLRSNITTDEHPLGVFHPHAEHHNIKKENIGLIEVMGLAVLPARLKAEMEQVRECILHGRDLSVSPDTEKHKAWLARFSDKYSFTPENTEEILKNEIGRTFLSVLSDAGVFKRNAQGRASFLKFIDAVNEK